MPDLGVAAAAVIRDARLLVVSKRAAPDGFYLPGGKPEPGETLADALRRELREELGVGATRLSRSPSSRTSPPSSSCPCE